MPGHPFKKTCPCTILSPPFFNFSDSPTPSEEIKIYFPPLKWGEGGLNYVNKVVIVVMLMGEITKLGYSNVL